MKLRYEGIKSIYWADMFHTTLYRLERGQRRVLAILGVLFLLVSAAWFYIELYHFFYPMDSSAAIFPMEPIVVFIGGTATLLASYWPFKPGYADLRVRGRGSFDYMSNNGSFKIGRDELGFTLSFSKASGENIYLYSDPKDIDVVALVPGAETLSEIRDATILDYTNRSLTVPEGGVLVLRNLHGNYAAVQIHDVKDNSLADDRDEVTFSWLINPHRGADFS